MKCRIALLVTAVSVLLLMGLNLLWYQQAGEEEIPQRVWHHELAAQADTTLGTVSVPADGMVNENFATHLPLVIIDTFGEEIVNYKYYDLETDSFIYQQGIDPYISMKISIVDHPEMVNTLSDEPTMSALGRIKIRGNSSAVLSRAKKQYLLKLEDENGDNLPLEILGMEASDTWILNGTLTDRSYLRNYLAFNTAGELDPYTPDIRMCEVVLKTRDEYEYLGLYGMYEKIEQGEGRVDIPAVSNPISIEDRSYILQRDRKDPDSYSMAVWSTENQRGNNWISLEYPSPENITEEYWEYIQNDIRQIEEILYSEDKVEFLRYPTVLDVDSFVDYFILNEFFSNYDAGWNSTFLYKTQEGKVAVGPVWDFDGAMDNYDTQLMEINAVAFSDAPWFRQLLRSESFVNKVEQRYRELRAGLLSDENIQQKIQAAARFLAYPAQRDRSRWEEANVYDLGSLQEEDTDLWIQRDQGSWQSEVQRMQDVLQTHGDYLDNNLAIVLEGYVEQTPAVITVGGWLIIAAFFVSIILIQRVRKIR